MQKGQIHHRTAKRYNPIIVALALQHGGMRKLARKLGMPKLRLYNWAKGLHVPDFSLPLVAKQHKKTERQLVILSGKTLVEVFGQPEQIERGLVPLREACARTYDPTPTLDFKIDLQRALAALTAPQRQLVEMTVGGFAHEEIAGHLGCSRQRIGQQLDSIRDRLRRSLKIEPTK